MPRVESHDPAAAIAEKAKQGYDLLLRNTDRAMLRGFLLAFAISAACGLFIPVTTLPSEMAARGSPRVADLLVAFASGISYGYWHWRACLSAGCQANEALDAAFSPADHGDEKVLFYLPVTKAWLRQLILGGFAGVRLGIRDCIVGERLVRYVSLLY